MNIKNNKFKLSDLARILFFLIACYSANASAAEILMKSLGYEPKQIEIRKGETVVWKNSAHTEHSATSDSDPTIFDTGMVLPNKESKPVRFDKPGIYKYHCSLHGSAMSGTVVVK